MKKILEYNNKETSLKLEGYTVEELKEIIPLIIDKDTTVIDSGNNFEKTNPAINFLKFAKENKEAKKEKLTHVTDRSFCRLPKSYTKFRCPSCNQSILLNTKKDNKFIAYNISDRTLNKINVLELPKINNNNITDVYKDVMKYKKGSTIIIESDLNNTGVCPVCLEEHTLSEWVSEPKKENTCLVCGEKVEEVLTKDNYFFICSNDCYNKIKTK